MAVGERFPVVMGIEKAATNGVATLDDNGILTQSQRPAANDILMQDGITTISSILERAAPGGEIDTALKNKVNVVSHVQRLPTIRKNLSSPGWYRLIHVNRPSGNSGGLDCITTLTIGTGYNTANPLQTKIQLNMYSHNSVPTINILSCRRPSKVLDSIRITTTTANAYIDIYYPLSTSNTICISPEVFYFDVVAKTVDLLPVDDAPDGETVIITQSITAIPSGPVAIATPPTRIDFPFVDGISGLHSCYYTKDQFNRVDITIGFAQCLQIVETGVTYLTIGILPVGFRPLDQIYSSGIRLHDDRMIRTYVDQTGVIQILPYTDMQVGEQFSLSFSYIAGN